MALVGLIVMLVAVGLLAGAGAMIVAGGVLIVRSSSPIEGGACGACGYSARGLTALKCPECGADLREAGIHPATRRRGTLGTWLLISGLILFLGLTGCCGFGLFSATSSAPVTHPLPTIPSPPPAPAPATP